MKGMKQRKPVTKLARAEDIRKGVLVTAAERTPMRAKSPSLALTGDAIAAVWGSFLGRSGGSYSKSYSGVGLRSATEGGPLSAMECRYAERQAGSSGKKWFRL